MGVEPLSLRLRASLRVLLPPSAVWIFSFLDCHLAAGPGSLGGLGPIVGGCCRETASGRVCRLFAAGVWSKVGGGREGL